ncbi:MAG: phosphoheptose isomerase [Phycisphaeraceae bacterium]|nr:MAG: phosphoheptose isomerase [Phycisphaeraceae bacterium]
MAERDTIQTELNTYADLARTFAADESVADKVARAADLSAESLRSGGKLLAVGNGGSCADAVHFCEELTGRYRDDRAPIAALACADAGHITCTANDYGFEHVFARWVEALARPGDVLVALSTSGNSANVIRAVKAARARKAHVLCLLGKGGGQLAGTADIEWVAPGETADRIQELHMLVLHTLVGAIERALTR